MARLSMGDQQQLATALLRCECIRDRRIRDQMLQTLPTGQPVGMSRQDNDRADVIGILNALSGRVGGLHVLYSCIDLYEPGSDATEQVRRLVERMEPNPPLSADAHAALDELLGVISCPEAEDLYWAAVGEFGPAPSVPGGDLVSLAHDLLDVVDVGSAPPLLLFLEAVAERAAGHRAVLRQWIEDHASAWGGAAREAAGHHSRTVSSVNAQADCYLVLQLETFGANAERFLLSAWFQRGRASKVLRRDEEPMIIEDLTEVIDQLVTRDAEVTRDAASRLVVEVILPRRLINCDIDQWLIAPAGFPRPVGTQHPLVVRPFERMHDRAMYRDWRRKWEWLKEHGNDPGVTADSIHWITRAAEVNTQQLMIQMRAADMPVCVSLGFAPPAASELGHDEFAAGVHAGAPVIVWCRDGRPADGFEAELRRLLAGHGLLEIPELVHGYRQEAHYPGATADHLGRHLTLLWDDFDRVPEGFDRLLAPSRGAR